MTMRVLAGAAMGAALAGIAVGALSLREPHAVAPAPPSAADEREPHANPPHAEPLPPFLPAERPRVPAGILGRAATARALERGPACTTVEAREEPPLCAPEQRQSIEIEWHVAPRDP